MQLGKEDLRNIIINNGEVVGFQGQKYTATGQNVHTL